MGNKPVVRVCVPYPYYGSVKKECRNSLKSLRFLDEVDFQFRLIQGSNIACQRNAGVNGGTSKRAFQRLSGFDYILMVDSDIAFRPDQFSRLIDYNFDIVSGSYQCRESPHTVVGGDCVEEYEGSGRHVSSVGMFSMQDNGLRSVDWTGAGFLLIKKVVFERLEYPWFRGVFLPHHGHDGRLYNSWAGEDVGFCLAAKKHGYAVMLDLDCRVAHLLDNGPPPSGKIIREVDVAERQNTQ